LGVALINEHREFSAAQSPGCPPLVSEA